ncbi:ANTAR domain-containing protein [Cellulomonas sp. 179-A 4D5 NHS]|uniref:ANTAR domain-containing protein n=1 Tax=Cellulomonas sp. 179-A 4D5 NHS TaxID=3142378 RepID=UPI0039A001BF
MDRSVDRVETILELQDLALSTTGVQDFIDGAAEVAARYVPGGCHVEITVHHPERATLTSRPRAADPETVAPMADDTPAEAAARAGAPIIVGDLTLDPRWDAWSRAARAAGFMSVAVLPGPVGDCARLALTLYGLSPDVGDAATLRLAEMCLTDLHGALRVAQRLADVEQANEDLKTAIASRAVIDQAMGVIMAQNRCSAPEAFKFLRRASQNRNMKVRELAADLITGVTHVAPVPPAPFYPRGTAPADRTRRTTTPDAAHAV